MPGFDPFSPEPTILDARKSEQTQGEIHALLASMMGLQPEDIQGFALVVDLGGKFTFGGSPTIRDAKDLLVDAVMSGVLNTPDVDSPPGSANPGLN